MGLQGCCGKMLCLESNCRVLAGQAALTPDDFCSKLTGMTGHHRMHDCMNLTRVLALKDPSARLGFSTDTQALLQATVGAEMIGNTAILASLHYYSLGNFR